MEDYLERVLVAVVDSGHAVREGAVQAAASLFDAGERTMLDREAVLHFKDKATRKQTFDQITGPILQACQEVRGVPGKIPSSFGGKCDLLAVDEHGQLLAVEVKPRDVGSIRWAAAQATVYARLFESWINSDGSVPSTPREVLQGMVHQRVQVGLARRARPDISERPEVVPVVALQRGVPATYLDGLRKVQRALREARVGYDTLRLYEVNMAGRLDPIEL